MYCSSNLGSVSIIIDQTQLCVPNQRCLWIFFSINGVCGFKKKKKKKYACFNSNNVLLLRHLHAK